MTLLQTMPDDDPGRVLLRTSDPDLIGRELAALGIGWERWSANDPLPAEIGEQAILDAHAKDIDRLCADGGYRLVDIVRMVPSDEPGCEEKVRAARGKFLEEHTHTEDEVRFFVEGRGCFYLHLGERVHAVVCEAGDLLSVPAGTRHWFDMGTRPLFCAIRFFQKEDGWIGDFVEDGVAAGFPSLDELTSAHP
ncbi:acireductone dioxygenase apoprotein [Actinomadura pelletieri DSM 43383]|uniref:Acireductone dioxygenase n=1 Tax=Actinomadura pelletieri DSM 43383 TaxID=1120940 RepID=A0A495Q9U5_9ACTN|nr:cupin domain-containing protein [Actinomadura pelletieri]RKS68227.1 acireductone dioxygenase apoprotein [Actinomadura pelletieri DSM 43383]